MLTACAQCLMTMARKHARQSLPKEARACCTGVFAQADWQSWCVSPAHRGSSRRRAASAVAPAPSSSAGACPRAHGLVELAELRDKARVRLCARPFGLHELHRLVRRTAVVGDEERGGDTRAAAHTLCAMYEHARGGVAQCRADPCRRPGQKRGELREGRVLQGQLQPLQGPMGAEVRERG